MNRIKDRKGFTIVELVIVIAVIAILATVLVPTFSNVIANANKSSALQKARNELTAYMIDHAQEGSANFVIGVDDYYFTVIKGELNANAYDSQEAAQNAVEAEIAEDGFVWSENKDLDENKDIYVYAKAGKQSLEGLRISFLGDSITSFKDYTYSYSYVAEEEGNKMVLDGGVSSTWWMQAVEKFDMELCKNNSRSGAPVFNAENLGANVNQNGLSRCEDLSSDGKNPDIIVIYLGTNDVVHQNTVGSFDKVSDIFDGTNYIESNLNAFAPAYAAMVHKIQAKYPNADIYLCTIDSYKTSTTKDPQPYNEAIKKVAEVFGCTVVDFYEDTPISPATADTYTFDGTHPKKNGMTEMFETLKDALATKYIVE